MGIVLGLVQGLTEFIPVSSSGHLILFDSWLDAGQNHMFLQFINIGTLLALLFFFRKTIWEVLGSKDWKLMLNLLIIAIPAGVIGLLLGDIIEEAPFFMSVWTVLVGLFAVGVLMIFAEKLPRLPRAEQLTPRKSLFIGLVQCLAIIPGVSRSGSTILAGKTMGLTDEKAARFSFLASIPIMLGVCLRLFISSNNREYFVENWQF
ncbi:undecaprenyl-diphosphate phosphatase, partial [Candidatus Saccharibacteria bacterium]|nr:undecaprenyl-diphosphate phosphatase [Candidatus Saccharibacteria bacterium]